MTKNWLPVVLALALFAGLGFATPVILNTMIIPTNMLDASAPTANAPTRGGIIYGTSTSQLLISPGDGGTWLGVPMAHASLSAFYPAGTLANGSVAIQSRFTAPATFTRLNAAIATVGTDAAHTFTVDIFDLTTSSVACVTAAIPCNQVIGNAASVSCAAAAALADDIQLRVNDGSCLTTAPALNITAEYR